MATDSVQPFGARLARAMERYGKLCVGIDPHASTLKDWGLAESADGALEFGLAAVKAAAGRAGIIKPQVALFERFGSAGLAALERVQAEAKENGILVLADAKRGDIGSTMAGYAQAWLDPSSPLAADAVTVSPYLGVGALGPVFDTAAEFGGGVFVLGLTSNPEGARVQHAGGDDSAALRVVNDVAEANQRMSAPLAGSAPDAAATAALGDVGLVVGATTGDAARKLGIDLASGKPPLLTPGYGAQGATASGLAEMFGAVWDQVVVPASRSLAKPHAMEAAIEAAQEDLASVNSASVNS